MIFDGLDELVMQGKAMQDLAQQFIQEVKSQINNMNHLTCRLMVILSGRKLLIDACQNEFKKKKQIITLLPYYVPEKNRTTFTDEEKLIGIDQRQIWWKEYGLATGNDFQGLPEGLERDQLGEITSEPLLNHLVAVTYREDPDFFTPDTNVNNIYKRLIDKIFNRVWVNNPDHCHPALTGITSEDQFFDILQEIAVAAWHSRATRENIWKRIVNLNYQDLFKDFEKEAEKGVTRVLTGFYFHQAQMQVGGEPSFEFTHKTFGEYLLARHLAITLGTMHEEYLRWQKNRKGGWNEIQALRFWAELCGQTSLDPYVFRFLCNEITLRPLKQVTEWQSTLLSLFNYMLDNGIPMEEFGLSFMEQSRQARNAEEALFAILNACARFTHIKSKINWGTRFLSWINRLLGEYFGINKVLAFDCLSFLELPDIRCIASFFYRANFSDSNLKRVSFFRAVVQRADFQRADLRGANFRDADLGQCDFRGAKLRNAGF